MSSSILFPTNEYATSTKSSEQIQKLMAPECLSRQQLIVHLVNKNHTLQLPFVYKTFASNYTVCLDIVCQKAISQTPQNQILICESLKSVLLTNIGTSAMAMMATGLGAGTGAGTRNILTIGNSNMKNNTSAPTPNTTLNTNSTLAPTIKATGTISSQHLNLIFQTTLECLNNLNSTANQHLAQLLQLLLKYQSQSQPQSQRSRSKMLQCIQSRILSLGQAGQPTISKVTAGRLIAIACRHIGRKMIKGQMIDILKRILADNEIEARKVWVGEIFPRLLSGLQLEFVELHLQEKIYECVYDENEDLGVLALKVILTNAAMFSAEEQSSRIVKLFVDSLTSKSDKIVLMVTEQMGSVFQKLINPLMSSQALCSRFWRSLVELAQSKSQKVLNNMVYNLPGILLLASSFHRTDCFVDVYVELFYEQLVDKQLLCSYFHEIVTLYPSKRNTLKQVIYWMFAEMFDDQDAFGGEQDVDEGYSSSQVGWQQLYNQFQKLPTIHQPQQKVTQKENTTKSNNQKNSTSTLISDNTNAITKSLLNREQVDISAVKIINMFIKGLPHGGKNAFYTIIEGSGAGNEAGVGNGTILTLQQQSPQQQQMAELLPSIDNRKQKQKVTISDSSNTNSTDINLNSQQHSSNVSIIPSSSSTNFVPPVLEAQLCEYLLRYMNLLQIHKHSQWIILFLNSIKGLVDYFSIQFVEKALLPKLYVFIRNKVGPLQLMVEIMVLLLKRDIYSLMNFYASKIYVDFSKSPKAHERKAALYFFYQCTLHFSIDMYQEYKLGEKFLSFNSDKAFENKYLFVKYLERVQYFLNRQERLQMNVMLSRLKKDADCDKDIIQAILQTNYTEQESTKLIILQESRLLKESEKQQQQNYHLNHHNHYHPHPHQQQTLFPSFAQPSSSNKAANNKAATISNRRESRETKQLKKEDILKKRIETTKSKTKMLIKQIPKKKTYGISSSTNTNSKSLSSAANNIGKKHA